MIVNIFDYQVGNLKSLYNFFYISLGLETKVITKIPKSYNFDILVFPGVGSFKGAMMNIKKKDKELIHVLSKEKKKNIVGICLGMQILAQESLESPNYSGLGLIEGKVKKLKETQKYKLPNVGWHEIISNKNNLLRNLSHNNFYFDHSFYLDNNKHTVGHINYSQKIPAIIKKKNIIGFQFHPEKSQKAGIEMFNNYLKTI